jgi:glycosyltransferase involved in cell wall biosynthesis
MSNVDRLPGVTVIVPVLDEIEHFDDALLTVLDQSYPGELDFVFVDGGSRDGTRERLDEFEAAGRLRVVDNPRPGIPVSLNLGLAAATGAVLVRMDAHTRYQPDYVSLGVEALVADTAEWVAGPALAEGDGQWSRWVAAALATPLGVGGADFRRAGRSRLTDAAFGGALWRERLRELGGWDETWQVNEDGELAARALRAGWRIMLEPAMAARYIPRDDPIELARQYWRYGFWRARTSVAYPESMRPSHVAPPLLVLAVLAAIAPLPLPRALRRAAWAAMFVYGGALSYAGTGAVRDSGRPAAWYKVITVLKTMHLSWGAASIAGFVRFGSPLPALAHVARRLARRLRGG